MMISISVPIFQIQLKILYTNFQIFQINRFCFQWLETTIIQGQLKLLSQITNLSSYCHSFQRFFMKQINFKTITFSINMKLSSFRSSHLTDLFLSFLNDKISKGSKNGLYTGMILIDLQKTFDIINNKLQLDKLIPTSFSKNTISWYESYSEQYNFQASPVFMSMI